MHDDDDWDSGVAEGILEFLFCTEDGSMSWFRLTLFLTVAGLACWHFLS